MNRHRYQCDDGAVIGQYDHAARWRLSEASSADAAFGSPADRLPCSPPNREDRYLSPSDSLAANIMRVGPAMGARCGD